MYYKLICNQLVVGSTPTAGSIFDKIQEAYKLELSLCVNKDDIFNNEYIDAEYALSLK